MDVMELVWGITPVDDRLQNMDVVVACDVMYIAAAVELLVSTIQGLLSASGTAYVAHGRNQQAREEFLQACKHAFEVEVLSQTDMDETYRCDDVEVLILTHATS